MSTGGKFIIEANNIGMKQDAILLNYELMQNRIVELNKECLRIPILKEIEKTHQVYIKKYYKPTMTLAMEYQSILAETGEMTYDSTSRFSIINYGDFTCEYILNIKLTGLSVVNPLDRCQYYDFVGHRVINHVSYDYNGNTIDEYSGEAYNIFYNFIIPKESRRKWRESVGQEVPVDCYVQQDDNDEYRECKRIVAGPQTPKIAHGEVDMWIPILFDFCRRPDSCLFNDRIPFGQKFLFVRTNPLSSLINIINNGGGGAFNSPVMTGRLYVNHIFIDKALRKMLNKVEYVSLIRVFKEAQFAASSGREKLNTLRFPIETLYFGLRPVANINVPNKWHLFSSTNDQTVAFPVRIPNATPPPVDQLAFRNATLFNLRNELTNVSFEFANVIVVNDAESGFYSKLQPLTKSNSPRDPGLMCFSFNFADEHTDKYDYSGYFNIDSGGDFYMNYTANVAGNVYIMARCFNWIEIDKSTGNLSIKYRA